MASGSSLPSLYFFNVKMAVSRAMQFRADFTLGVFSSLLFSILGPIGQYLIFRLTRGYPGWTISEMIVFQGMFVFWTGIRDTLFGGVRYFIMDTIRKGDFDRILLKPYHSAGFVLASGFSFQSAGSILAGAVILTLSLGASGATPGVLDILAFLALLPCAVILHMAVTLLFCSITTMVVHSRRFSELFDRILDFSGYPAEVFPNLARLVYVVVVPFAIFIYFPARALLGKLDVFMVVGAVISVFLFFVSLRFWNTIMKRYTSAGG